MFMSRILNVASVSFNTFRKNIILAHPIRISEILPWDRKSYLTHAILPRTSSNVILYNCILAYSGTSVSLLQNKNK